MPLPSKVEGREAMLALSDEAFVAAHIFKMFSYSDQLPCDCQGEGCSRVIVSPTDLRKLAGRYLCPECFARIVRETLWQYRQGRGIMAATPQQYYEMIFSAAPLEPAGLYLLRVVELLPPLPLIELRKESVLTGAV